MVVGPASRSMGTFVASLCEQLQQAQHELELIAEPTTAKQYRLPSTRPLWPLSPRRFYLWGRVVRRILGAREVLRNSDIIHAHGLGAAGYAMFLTALSKPRVPLVVSLYEMSNPRKRADSLVRRVFMWQLGRRADLISGSSLRLTAKIDRQAADARSTVSFLVSPRVEKLVKTELLNRKQRVENWGKLAAKERLRNRGQLVLAVGTVDQEKRFDRFVAAMETMTHPATAVVIGEGDPQLLARLRSLGQDAQVYFLGARANIQEWLQAASVLVVTSQWEARAFVTQEAMAVGLPVVASPVGRLRDLLSPSAVVETKQLDQALPDLAKPQSAVGGIFINPEDPEETAGAITQLLSNPGMWYDTQAQARNRALTWPSIETMARDWLEIYGSCRRNRDR